MVDAVTDQFYQYIVGVLRMHDGYLVWRIRSPEAATLSNSGRNVRNSGRNVNNC